MLAVPGDHAVNIHARPRRLRRAAEQPARHPKRDAGGGACISACTCPHAMISRMNSLLCFRCGHTWTARKSGRPVQCPRCHSPIWDRAVNPQIGDFHQVAAMLNDLQTKGVFREWVIIGKVAYIFHYQPEYTHDLDVLVRTGEAAAFDTRVLPSVEQIAPRVADPEAGDTFLFNGLPVLVLSGDENAIVRDVVRTAVRGHIGDQPVKVADLEHTILLALIRFSPTDWGRIDRLLPFAKVDKLHRLIGRFDNAQGTLAERLSTLPPRRP